MYKLSFRGIYHFRVDNSVKIILTPFWKEIYSKSFRERICTVTEEVYSKRKEFALFFWKGSTLRRKNWICSRWEQILSSESRPFSEGTWWAGMQIGSLKSQVVFFLKVADNVPSVSSPQFFVCLQSEFLGNFCIFFNCFVVLKVLFKVYVYSVFITII